MSTTQVPLDSTVEGATGRFWRWGLKSMLVLLFVVILAIQALLPWWAQDTARTAPEFAFLQYPVLALSLGVLGCVQVVAIATWRLVDFSVSDRIFSQVAFRWVAVLAVAPAVAAGCCFLLLMVVCGYTQGPPGLVIIFAVGSVGSLGVSLVVVVLRGLLRRAVNMRTELEAVI